MPEEPYFANLLPPVVVRKKLEKCLHISKNNVFGFLKAIGGDCAGAVALYAPGFKTHHAEEEQLAPRCGLSPKLVLTRLDGLAEKIVPAARTLAERLAVKWPSTVYSKIIAIIEGQAARVGV